MKAILKIFEFQNALMQPVKSINSLPKNKYNPIPEV